MIVRNAEASALRDFAPLRAQLSQLVARNLLALDPGKGVSTGHLVHFEKINKQ